MNRTRRGRVLDRMLWPLPATRELAARRTKASPDRFQQHRCTRACSDTRILPGVTCVCDRNACVCMCSPTEPRRAWRWQIHEAPPPGTLLRLEAGGTQVTWANSPARRCHRPSHRGIAQERGGVHRAIPAYAPAPFASTLETPAGSRRRRSIHRTHSHLTPATHLG